MENDEYPSPSFDLFDLATNSSVTFNSESDALFAAFCLGDQLGTKFLFPTRYIDAFIRLLKHPRFHTDKLTFESTLDMIDRIISMRREAALQRREIALKFPTPDFGKMFPGNVPRLVLELVSEELAQSAAPLQICSRDTRHHYKDRDNCHFTEQTLEQKALLNMCLVHPTWKVTTQRFLARRLAVRSNAEIYGFMASPLMGPSTHQLCYHFEPDEMHNIPHPCERDSSEDSDSSEGSSANDSENSSTRQNSSNHEYDVGSDGHGDTIVRDNVNQDHAIHDDESGYHEESSPMSGQAGNLSLVLSVCTGIRVLQIHGSLVISEIGSDPFHRIAQLQNLEVLSLGDQGSGRSDTLLNICTALPNMRKLKSLTLSRFKCPRGQVIPPSLDKLSPPSSLTDIVVQRCSENTKTEILLSWLFRPRMAYSVLSTALVAKELFGHNLHPRMLYRVLGPALGGLESITIRGFGNMIKCLVNILSKCSRLRAVCTRVPYRHGCMGFDWMPPNIERLQIYAGYMCIFRIYGCIEASIRTLPKLQSLYIVQHPESSDNDDQLMQKEKITELHALKLYCAQSGIEFSRRGIMEPIWW